MPLLRTTPARSRDTAANTNGKKTIIVCLPATDGRVGLPFASVQAMSAAATLRGVEVLRREINAAALTDKSESMKNIKVVVVDVGAINVGSPTVDPMSPQEAYKAMENWTASEKLTYGPAFASITRVTPPRPTSRWEEFSTIFNGNVPFGVRRKPSDTSAFVDSLVGIVSGERKGFSLFGLGLGTDRIRNCFRMERITVGAGGNLFLALVEHLIDVFFLP
jgi:hypothetical protein